jgi:malonyl-CoA decarboxylase
MDTATSGGLFDRALKRLMEAWRDVAGGAEDGDIAAQMRDCLEAKGGEVSARARSARLAKAYLAADADGKAEFLRILAGFDSDAAAVAKAVAALQAAGEDGAAAARARMQLRRALEAPRARLVTQFTSIPEGVKFVVELRAALLQLAKKDPGLAALDADIRALLAAWFDVGFLELRRIDWHSPANLLEKLVGYEAVHEIRGWRDLKNRLDSDRRCYAFFHPRMPDEPLIFVEIALVKGLAGDVRALLDEKAPVQDPAAADTAIFYSISNCQQGLAGISFGNFLIKRVVAELSAEFRNLKTFATLSPIPGFRRWLDGAAGDAALLSPDETTTLAAALGPVEGEMLPIARLLARKAWHRDAAVADAARPILTRLCARYLLAENAEAKPGEPKRARDPVAHFHMTNGAAAERLNWLADRSEKGQRESLGLMVNYLYDLDAIEANHEAYVGHGKRAASTTLKRLARGWS